MGSGGFGLAAFLDFKRHARSQLVEVRSIVSPLRDTSQLMQETEHFCRWRQEKVAKIVPYGPPLQINTLYYGGFLIEIEAVAVTAET